MLAFGSAMACSVKAASERISESSEHLSDISEPFRAYDPGMEDDDEKTWTSLGQTARDLLEQIEREDEQIELTMREIRRRRAMEQRARMAQSWKRWR